MESQKVGHLSTGTLLLQEQELKITMTIHKIAGNVRIADIVAKTLSQPFKAEQVRQHSSTLSTVQGQSYDK